MANVIDLEINQNIRSYDSIHKVNLLLNFLKLFFSFFFNRQCFYEQSHIWKLVYLNALKRTYDRNDSKRPAFSEPNKYFALRILSQSGHNFDLIYFFL